MKIRLPKQELSGHYKLEVRRHGELIHDTGWFDNLITDTGLNAIGEAVDIGRYAMVGTGNSIPANSNTHLESQVAYSDNNTNGSSSAYGVETAAPRYGWSRLTCPFAQGAVVGNIAEVGIGWATTSVFSRSLVSPAISIIAIDQLTVVYELRMYLPTVDVTGTVAIGSETYNYTIRPINADATAYAGDVSRGWAPKVLELGASARNWVQYSAYSSWYGAIGYGAPAVLQTNVGADAPKTTDGGAGIPPTATYAQAQSVTNTAYTTNSLRCEFVIGWTTSGGNIDGGQLWTSQTSGTANALNAVAFGGALFVAVGNAGTILTSPDGIAWTPQSSGTAEHLRGVTHNGSLFCAVGDAGTILTSPDGIAWTPQSSGTANALYAVAFGGGLFIAVGASGTILTSAAGVAWTPQSSGTAVTLYGVTHASGLYVAVGASGTLITSPSASGWTPRTSGTASDLRFVGSGVGLFVAGGPSNFTTRSLDGLSWTPGTLGVSGVNYGIVATSTMLFVVGTSYFLRSSGGVSWVNVSNGAIAHYGVAVGAKTLVAVGAGGAIKTSSAGGIQAFVYSALFGTYQMVLDGVIDKDNTKTLSMTWEQTWARRP